MHKLFLTVLFFCFYLTISAQDTFIKAIDEAKAGRNLRILPTPDEGWVLFSLDSLKLFKFNKCGTIEWAKKYHIPTTYPGDFIRAKNGNFLYLTRLPINANVSLPLLTMLSSDGTILWSKLYQDQNYSHVPYSVTEDSNGNFFIYASAAVLGGGASYRMLIKTDASGNVLWSNFYDNITATWGRAIVTSDNGVLFRAGTSIIKTDNAGTVQWITDKYSAEPYYAPVEVSDGYVVMGYTPGVGRFWLSKFTKQGILVGNKEKYFISAGTVSDFQQKANGNFLLLFQLQFINPNANVLIEFDKDLNIVRQSAIKSTVGTANVIATEFNITNTNNLLIAGTVTGYKPGTNSSAFVVRTNTLFQTGCDTTSSLLLIEGHASQNVANTSILSHPVTTVNQSVTAATITTTTKTLCGNSLTRKTVNIRQDTLMCEGNPLELKNTSADTFDSYLWSTGQTTPTISITQPGKYWLRAGYNCNSEFTSDTVVIQKATFPQPILSADSVFCNKPVTIKAEIPNGTYFWQDGSTQPTYKATKPGNYFVDITAGNCTKRFTIEVAGTETLLMPNVFTPNSDNLNEIFKPIENCGIAAGTLVIYNRWGQQVFKTSEIGNGWNGSVNGKKVSGGIYFWAIEYTNFSNTRKRFKGWVELVR